MHHRSDRKFSRHRFVIFEAMLLALVITLTGTLHRLRADTGTCGGATTTLPFTDTMGSFAYCFIAELYFQGITGGTTATTYSPSNNVTRDQMAVFLARTLDFSLKRGSRRAALGQFWTTTPLYSFNLGVTNLGGAVDVKSDGTDLWVAEGGNGHVSRVRASDGAGLGFWTTDAGFETTAVLCAMGRVFVIGPSTFLPGRLYLIDPTASPGAATRLTSMLGGGPSSIAFDGYRIWTANIDGSVSIVTRTDLGGPPWNVTNVPGFDFPVGILYDGANMWVTELNLGLLKKLDANGNVIQMAKVGSGPQLPVFDGRNIWVPNSGSNTVTVVRASDGTVLATLSGNGLAGPIAAAFDGERILVASSFTGSNVSLWKATDLTPLGSFSTGNSPGSVCSDGLYFWITLFGPPSQLARF